MDRPGMRYMLLIWKRRLEDLFILPFVVLGRWLASKEDKGPDHDIWFFFPFWHTGGAEKVHAQLANAFPDKKAIVVFTRHSQDERFRADFERSGHTVLDISEHTDNKAAYWNNLIWRGRISKQIRRQRKKPVVLNGQCNFAYKLSRWLGDDVPQVELIHSLNSFSYIRIPFLPFYRATVMISKNRIADHLALYERFGIPSYFAERILFIGNGVLLPLDPVDRDNSAPLKVMYAGRGTSEKRVHLVAAVLKAARNKGIPVKGIYMGDVDEGLRAPRDSADTYLGNLSHAEAIDETYRSADILIITSSEEGMPMVVMEAMGRGCAIIATPVGDIPLHVRPGVNGWLFTTVNDEDLIVQEGVDYLGEALEQGQTLSRMGRENIVHAREHFGLKTFEHKWRELVHRVQEENRP